MLGRCARLLVAVLAIAAPARGAVHWYQHYEQALELAAAGNWESALGELEEAAATEPRAYERIRTYGREFLFDYDPSFHMARCLIELGRFDEAAERLDMAREEAVTPSEDVAELARRLATERAAARRAEAPAPPPSAALRVDSSPSGARVSLDGQEIGLTPLAELELIATRHRLSVRADGYAPWDDTIQPTAGELLHLRVVLQRLAAAAPAATDRARTAAAPTTTRTSPAGSPPPQTRAAQPTPGPEESETAAPAGGADRGPAQDTAAAGASGRQGTEAETAAERERSAALGPIPADVAPGAVTRRPDAAPDSTARREISTAGWIATLLALVLTALVAERLHRRRRRAPWRMAGYTVTGELGRGGMATTYRAVRSTDRRVVALKIPHESGDASFRSRFLREGRLGETLHHPRIVRIFEAGESNGRLFLAMELLEGHTLADEIRRHPDGLPPRHAVELAHDICEALDYAHAKGVVHRDLKPENIMLRDEGLKVMDFGVARLEGDPSLTTSRFFFGSPLYAAPELVDPRSIDHRADLYSLGILLFEMLEGAPPFVNESVFRLLEMHQKTPLPVFSRPIPSELEAMVRRLCAKDRDGRYPSAQAVLIDLKRQLFQAAEPATAGAAGADDHRSPPA